MEAVLLGFAIGALATFTVKHSREGIQRAVAWTSYRAGALSTLASVEADRAFDAGRRLREDRLERLAQSASDVVELP